MNYTLYPDLEDGGRSGCNQSGKNNRNVDDFYALSLSEKAPGIIITPFLYLTQNVGHD